MRVSQRRATVEESARFAALGKVSETVAMRAMAQAAGGGAPALVKLKAVDGNWPMLGTFTLEPGALAARPRGRQVAISPALADRIGVRVGSWVRLGAASFQVIGVIANEPDRLGEGFSLGPTVIVDAAAIDATGLIQPGSLYESRYRLLLPPRADAAAVGKALQRRFPSAGWNSRTPEGATDRLRRTVTQLGQFLLLVGLGLGNATAVWVSSLRGIAQTTARLVLLRLVDVGEGAFVAPRRRQRRRAD